MNKLIFILNLLFFTLLFSESRAQLDLNDLIDNVETLETSESAPDEQKSDVTDENLADADADTNDEIPPTQLEDKKTLPTDNFTTKDIEIINKSSTDLLNNDEKSLADSVNESTVTEENPETAPDNSKNTENSENLPDTDYDIFADDAVEDLFDESALQDLEPLTDSETSPMQPANPDDFMDEYFEDLEQQKQKDATAYKAQKDALHLLSDGPQIVTLKDEQKKSLRGITQKRKEMEAKLKAAKAKQPKLPTPQSHAVSAKDLNTDKTTEKAPLQASTEPEAPQPDISEQEAPFGLLWNAGKTEIEKLGFTATPAELADYHGVYVIKNQQQPQKLFTLITAIFGKQDHLHAIYAQSRAIDDTPQAEKILQLYHQYYDALKHKYGNDREHFTPNRETVVEQLQPAVSEQNSDTPEADKNSEPMADETQPRPIAQTQAKSVDNGIGNDNFLAELRDEKANLFATFTNGKIKVTLTVLVNENNQSYITLDYENIPVTQQEQNANLDALINDL